MAQRDVVHDESELTWVETWTDLSDKIHKGINEYGYIKATALVVKP